ncbi:hypothetical protein BHE74_00033252 [Ensete ventricosum]|nr:hypothetical protein BHE74_00033252 [Ensete ventricosum]
MVVCRSKGPRQARKEHRGVISSPPGDLHLLKSHRAKARSMQNRRKRKKETLSEGAKGGVASTEWASSLSSTTLVGKNFRVLSKASVSPEIYKACSLPMSILPKPPSVRRRSTFLHLVDSERSSGKRSEGHP